MKLTIHSRGPSSIEWAEGSPAECRPWRRHPDCMPARSRREATRQAIEWALSQMREPDPREIAVYGHADSAIIREMGAVRKGLQRQPDRRPAGQHTLPPRELNELAAQIRERFGLSHREAKKVLNELGLAAYSADYAVRDVTPVIAAAVDELRAELSPQPGPGRPKGEDNLDAVVHLRCKRSDKGRWVLAARKRGMTLSKWIIERLNASD